jgi:hypothetical protein
VNSLIHIILKIFIWSGNHKFYIQFLRQFGLQSLRITLYFALNKLSTEKVLSITRLIESARSCGASADASASQSVLALAKWHFLAL